MKSKGPLLLVVALLAIVGVALGLRMAGSPSGGRTVTLYTAHSQQDVDALVPLFEKATGIQAHVVKMGSGEIVQRVRAEANNPQCDVIWSIAGDQLQANHDLLAPYTPKSWGEIDDAFKVGTNWLPYTGILVVFCANTALEDERPAPQSWTELADPDWKGKISSARADKSGSAYMQLMTVLTIHGAKGWDVYRGALANFALSGSSSAVPRFVNDGESAVGITLEDNALRYVKGGGPVRIVYPTDGTSLAPDGVALVDGAPHGEEARAFVEWALSKPTQDLLVERMGRRPVRKDGATPPGLPPLSEIELVPYDFEGAAADKAANVERWTKLVAELGR